MSRRESDPSHTTSVSNHFLKTERSSSTKVSQSRMYYLASSKKSISVIKNLNLSPTRMQIKRPKNNCPHQELHHLQRPRPLHPGAHPPAASAMAFSSGCLLRARRQCGSAVRRACQPSAGKPFTPAPTKSNGVGIDGQAVIAGTCTPPPPSLQAPSAHCSGDHLQFQRSPSTSCTPRSRPPTAKPAGQGTQALLCPATKQQSRPSAQASHVGITQPRDQPGLV